MRYVGRQERMQERMRGAQRHQIEDESFGFIVPVEPAAVDAPLPAAAPTPSKSTPVKSHSSPVQPSSAALDSRRKSQKSRASFANSSPLRNTRGANDDFATQEDSDSDKGSVELDSGPVVRSTPTQPRRTSRMNQARGSELRKSKVASIPEVSDGEDDATTKPWVEPIDEAIEEELFEETMIGTAQKPTPRASIYDLPRNEADEALPKPVRWDEQQLSGHRDVAGQTEKEVGLSSPPSARARARLHHQFSSPAIRGEEVGESPADAPGSGARRFVRISDAAQSSSRLQRLIAPRVVEPPIVISSASETSDDDLVDDAVPDSEEKLASSSHRDRATEREPSHPPDDSAEHTDVETPSKTTKKGKERPAEIGTEVLLPRNPSSTLGDNEDNQGERNGLPRPKARVRRGRPPRVVRSIPEEPSEENEVDEAQEIDDVEAARRLGANKRTRPGRPSPVEERTPEAEEQPQPKRRRRVVPASPAAQSQPQPKGRGRPKGTKGRPRAAEDKESRDPAVSIAVHRFQNSGRGASVTGGAAAALSNVIPHSKRSGVNVVDVLAQLCDDLITNEVHATKERTENLEAKAQRKQHNTKRMALEAFRLELRNRFMEHVSFPMYGTHCAG